MLRLSLLQYSKVAIRPIIYGNALNSFANDASNSPSSDDQVKNLNTKKFDDNILKQIVCPLTKKQLRYDEERQLLINDELSIAYKINNGIPNLIPTDAVKLERT